MSEQVHFIRQWWLLRKLTAPAARWTLKELAQEFAVNTRTIKRDLNTLAEVGFRLEETSGPHGEKAWRIKTESIVAGLALRFDEIAALYLGRRFLEPLAGTPIWEAAQSAFRKMRLGVGTAALNYLDKFATAFHQTSIGGSDYAARGEAIDQLMICIEDQTVAEMIYHAPHEEQAQSLTIHPYGLIYHRGSLYVVAFAPHRNDLRHYKLDRIQEVAVTAQKFTKPDSFQLADHLASTFGVFHTPGELRQIRIRFDAATARYIQEHHWHPSQQFTPLPDGSVRLELELSDLHEIKAWVLSFGAKAVVEEPQELRDVIRLEVQQMLVQLKEQ